jgi:plastocyanin
MRKVLILVFTAAAVGAVLVAGASAKRTATPMLTGTVGPGFTIDLKMNGKAVKTLKAGTYKVVIHDKATIHGWSLDGPHGFAKDIAAVPFTGTKTVTLNLKAGKYKFYCPPHEPTMFGRFTVK